MSIEDDYDDDPKPPTGGGTIEKTVSTTDPDSGMFVKGEHERQFAYEAHTVGGNADEFPSAYPSQSGQGNCLDSFFANDIMKHMKNREAAV